MSENFVVCHWNESEDGWVECGPYIHGWYDTREDADVALETWRKENVPSDGGSARSAVLTADEYYHTEAQE
jgi:hypothetical protein